MPKPKSNLWLKIDLFVVIKIHLHFTHLNTLRTRIVAGELTKFRSSFSLMVDCSNVSSRGFDDADVAIANAAAAVDVLLLNVDQSHKIKENNHKTH